MCKPKTTFSGFLEIVRDVDLPVNVAKRPLTTWLRV